MDDGTRRLTQASYKSSGADLGRALASTGRSIRARLGGG